ncbi:PREDICTED: zinc finger HIT domain-containing protein 2-like [Priapulus caudatus]|uniref:Zinc finger HIT domain-containing protein 2-like n=1 Tax=Priapulus caudatus TaxID=37621 RepID=A0ABM1EJP2_PRICU|nr:PREDICTED: zinc finger HIT domain-containing protein 2-like [Priapulus caudatus]
METSSNQSCFPDENVSASTSQSTTGSCNMCLNAEAKYTCPRCCVRYCSITCYKDKKHESCSEQFYKDCCMQELNQFKVSPDNKSKMVDILKRLHEEEKEAGDFESANEQPDIEDRLAGLNLDTDSDEIWNRLTPEERNEFESLVNASKLERLVEIWEPWWNKQDQTLIQDVEKNVLEELLERCPEIPKTIPKIGQLLRMKPSQLLGNNIVATLYAYAYIARLYNGDYISLAVQAAETMLNLCKVLSSGYNYSTVSEALIASVDSSSQSARLNSREYSTAIVLDVCRIMEGPSKDMPLHYIIASLSEIHNLFTIAKKSLKTAKIQGGTSEENALLKKKCGVILKKLDFYLSWVQDYGLELQGLLPDIQIQHKLMEVDMFAIQEQQKQVEKCMADLKPVCVEHKLIEEL